MGVRVVKLLRVIQNLSETFEVVFMCHLQDVFTGGEIGELKLAIFICFNSLFTTRRQRVRGGILHESS